MRDEFKVFINSRLEEGQIKIIRRPLNVAAKEAVG
jgi:adenylylsulfate reductase subunit A